MKPAVYRTIALLHGIGPVERLGTAYGKKNNNKKREKLTDLSRWTLNVLYSCVAATFIWLVEAANTKDNTMNAHFDLFDAAKIKENKKHQEAMK